MECSVRRTDDWFFVVGDGKPIYTPAGTAVASHHEALAVEMAADVSRWGTDPTTATSAYALQAAYLDFGLTVPRAALEKSVLSMWPNDLFVHRPADPELMMPLLALWGEEPFGREEFASRVRAIPLRHLMVLVQCAAQYHSPVLGLQLLSTDRDPSGFALGACARYFGYLSRDFTLENGYLNFGSSTSGRHDPNDADDEYCDEQCCSDDGPDERVGTKCPIHRVFTTMRRWASYPEELA